MRVLGPTLVFAWMFVAACSGSPSPDDDDGGVDAGGTDAGCDDADGDGTCDAADLCAGANDAVDTDGDAIPDACDCDDADVCEELACYEHTHAPVTCACRWPLVDAGSGCTTTMTLWSAWDDRPSSPGDNATIQVGETILLDIDAVVGELVVHGDLYILDRPSTSLTVASIDLDGGDLHIGEPSKPFTGRLTITFDGALDRRLSVSDGGEVTIVGSSPTPTWTRLASDAAASATTLVVDAAAGVRAGDRIAITPSDFYPFAMGEGSYWTLHDGPVAPAQFVDLAQVTGTTLSLATPLAAPRNGTIDAVATDLTVDERAEVAFLSRNIVLASADDAHFQTDDSGLVIDYDSNGDFLLDGVEIRRAGIADSVRGYPINLYGTGTAQVMRSSISESVRGCVQLGGTGGATVQDNVCVDVLGHGLFVRAGSVNNVLRGNLMSHLRFPDTALAGEVHQVDGNFGGTSGIYSEEPLTDIRGNTASDSEGLGFWLSFASEVPMLPFVDNVAHSTFMHGILLAHWSNSGDSEYEPKVGMAPVAATLDGNAAWKCAHSGLSVYAPVTLTDGFFADNGRTSVERYDYGGADLGSVTGNVFVQTSPNDATVSTVAAAALGHHIAGDVSDNTFIGYPAGPTGYGVLAQRGYSWTYRDWYLETFGDNVMIDSDLSWRPATSTYGLLTAPASDPNGLVGPAGYFWVFDDPFVKDASCVPVMIGGMQNHVSCAGPYAALSQVAITSTGGPLTALALARLDPSAAGSMTTLDAAVPTHTIDSSGSSYADDLLSIVANRNTTIYVASVPGHASLAGVNQMALQFYIPPGVLGENGSAILAMKLAPTDSLVVHFRWVWFNLDSATVPMAASLAALFGAPPNSAIWYRDPTTGYVFFRLYDYGYCPPASPGCAPGTPWWWTNGNGGLWELVVDVTH